jgi:hypothetical protein
LDVYGRVLAALTAEPIVRAVLLFPRPGEAVAHTTESQTGAML